MRTIIKQNKSFLFPYLAFFILGGIILFLQDKGKIHLEINRHHNSFFDLFFKYITYLGDGFTVVIITIILLFIKFRFAILVGVANIISSGLTQILKTFFFADMARPKRFFQGIADLYFVPGVENYSYYTFPSGHTTVAFTLYFCLALIINNPLIKILLFALSLLISFSRVYLSQHFLNDIYAGSAIGIVVSLVIYYIIERSDRINKYSGLNNSLLKKG